ncbi:ExbD/TolR family protein [Hymenobacter metallicola]|uniref:Biopolymer transporter ExbD n=1 Tax=Hymenobacter metallicola TaxID=2563114 RepID=A0A4Z0QDV8_9BACT|nr:biopolymer transporter ExbD [Hymenobacter metallicola]TGE27539.1 biopolymer transporter ExbD [Hymenobacter metallicola]
MANSQPAPNTSLRSARRSFRRILHPDMTPMVGLGFLLVTFFLLAADFKKPTVMQLTMPVSSREEGTCCGCRSAGALTLLLGKGGQVHYYKGMYFEEMPKLHTIYGGSSGLRRFILEERASNPSVVILIKPTADAKYRDLVDVLDEMNITDQKKYAVMDLYKLDYALLKRYNL